MCCAFQGCFKLVCYHDIVGSCDYVSDRSWPPGHCYILLADWLAHMTPTGIKYRLGPQYALYHMICHISIKKSTDFHLSASGLWRTQNDLPLDLVISEDLNICSIAISDIALSDYFCISFESPIQANIPKQSKTTVTKRLL